MTSTWALFWACSRHLCLSPHCWGCRNQAPYWVDNRSEWVEKSTITNGFSDISMVIFQKGGKLSFKETKKTWRRLSLLAAPSLSSSLMPCKNVILLWRFLLHGTQGRLPRIKHPFFWESPKLGLILTLFKVKKLPKLVCGGGDPAQIDFDIFLKVKRVPKSRAGVGEG